jgi:hypothetical protein
MSGEFINPQVFLSNLDRMLAMGNPTDIWRIVNLEMWLRGFWGENPEQVNL